MLVDWEIEDLISHREIIITPYDCNAIQPNSLDIHLSSSFAVYQDNIEPIDPYDCGSIMKGCKSVTTDEIWIQPGDFILGETLERIELPANICAQIEGKSSWARLGLTIHQTGGWIDCGFRGSLTLEMVNVNKRPIILREGDPIAQLTFIRTNPARLPYNVKPGAKYNDQLGATPSMFFKNTKRLG